MKNGSNKRSTLRISALILLLAVAFAVPASAQVVSPMQSGHYMPTITGVRDMAYPPPGLFVLWYNVSISTDTYIDRDGNELKSLNLSEFDPGLPDVDLDLKGSAYTAVPAVYWGSNFSLLGGGRLLVGISPSWCTADVMLITERGAGAGDTTVTDYQEDKISGWGDLMVTPVGFSWGLEKFDITTTYSFYAPTGRYESGASDNMGLGFWTHQFQGYGYYYPVPDKSTSIMLGLTYELNGQVKDEDVNPGDRFTFEWGVSQYLTEQFEISVQGGHNWQISDDSGSDVYWDTGVHDSKSTIAFAAGFWPFPNWLYISGKYAYDFGCVQRFKNNTWMINLTFLTNVLTGE